MSEGAPLTASLVVLITRRYCSPPFVPPSLRSPVSPSVPHLPPLSLLLHVRHRINCQLTETTNHFMNEERFAMMRESAYLINTARGPSVEESALIQALQVRGLAVAAAAAAHFRSQWAAGGNKGWGVLFRTASAASSQQLAAARQLRSVRRSSHVVAIGGVVVVGGGVSSAAGRCCTTYPPLAPFRAATVALQTGKIAGCAMDVFEFEPLPVDSALRMMDNVLVRRGRASPACAACHGSRRHRVAAKAAAAARFFISCASH